MEPGWIYGDYHHVMGVASDGQHVILGNTCIGRRGGWLGIDVNTLNYLAVYPNPEQW